MRKGAGLANLRWTVRYRPRIIRLPAANIYWFEEAHLIFFEPTEKPLALPLWSVRPVVPLDLYQIQGAVEYEKSPEVQAFFRDLARLLLAICAQPEQGQEKAPPELLLSH